MNYEDFKIELQRVGGIRAVRMYDQELKAYSNGERLNYVKNEMNSANAVGFLNCSFLLDGFWFEITELLRTTTGKICRKCGKEAEFYKHKNTIDGLATQCKKCTGISNAKSRKGFNYKLKKWVEFGASGERHRTAKLKADEVREIKAVLKTRKKYDTTILRLAEAYNVSESAIRDIERGVTWKSVINF